MEIFKQIYTQEERETAIKKNIKQIKKLLKGLDKDTIKMNEHLIEEAATYAVLLEEINKIIERDGVVDHYQNGKEQWGTKKSVAAELKPKYTTIYQSLIKQLTELLPTADDKDAAQELMEFLNS